MTDERAWSILLLRSMLGVIFIMHGYDMWAIVGPDGAAALITRMGFPPGRAGLWAWYLILAHTLGGILLILGLWTRLAALAQVPIMAAAVFLLHWSQGFFMREIVVDPATGRTAAAGYEYPLLVLVATLAVALAGPGALSLDGWRRRRVLEVP